MVGEDLLTRLDARRHLYGKERHALHKGGVRGLRDRFAATRDENRDSAADSSTPCTCEALVSARLARRGRLKGIGSTTKLLSPRARAVRARRSTERALRDDRRRP